MPVPTLGSLLLEHNDASLAIVDELRSASMSDTDLESKARRLAALVEAKDRIDEALENWTPDR